MTHFNIKYIDHETNAKEVERAVQEEIDGPGQLPGYWAMHKKLREQHQLAVPRNLVYDMMTLVDPDGLRGGRSRHSCAEKKTTVSHLENIHQKKPAQLRGLRQTVLS